MAQAGPEVKVQLEVWRGGEAQTLPVVLGVLPGSEDEAKVQRPAKTSQATPAQQPLGLRLEDPDERARRTLGLGSKGGALVTSVEPGSVADEAGLRRGDVVVQVGDSPTGNAASAQRRLDAQDLGQGVRIRVMRGPYGHFMVLRRRAATDG